MNRGCFKIVMLVTLSIAVFSEYAAQNSSSASPLQLGLAHAIAQHSAASSSALNGPAIGVAQQLQEEMMLRANGIPVPKADETPISDELRGSIDQNCPEIIKGLIKLLNNRENVAEEIPKGFLLVGPPGIGKTTFGKYIAAKSNLKFFLYKAGSLANEYKNSGSSNLERIFARAFALGGFCILILDEIQVLIKQHNNDRDSESGAVTTLWQTLDECEKNHVFFIGTLNDMSGFPKPLANRFEGFVAEFQLPNEQQRNQLISFFMGNKQFGSNASAASLAKKTDGFSHRTLRTLVTKAFMLAHGKHEGNGGIIRADEIILADEDFSEALGSILSDEKKFLPEVAAQSYGSLIMQWSPVVMSAGSLGLSVYSTIKQGSMQRENIVLQRELSEKQNKLSEKQNSWSTWLWNNAPSALWAVVSFFHK